MKEKCLSCGTPFTSCHLEAPYLCVKCADLAVRQTRACDLSICYLSHGHHG